VIVAVVLLACVAVGAANAQGRRGLMTWDEVAAKAVAQLSADERKGGVLYVDQHELPAGSTLAIDGREVAVRRPSAMAFVDRVPQANWGHSCRYLLIDLESGQVESIEAQSPPFLRSVPATLRMILKGEAVPDWTVARP
jgi:hypothetical protein